MEFVWPEVIEPPRVFLGLGRMIFARRTARTADSMKARFGTPPRGWRHRKVETRNAVYELPLWLYWPVTLWDERYWRICEPLIRLGVFRVKEEGGYYNEGRFCLPPWLHRLRWCFLHDTDSAPPRREYWGPPRRRPTREQIERVYAILNRPRAV